MTDVPPPPPGLSLKTPPALTPRELALLARMARESLAAGIQSGRDVGPVGELADVIGKVEALGSFLASKEQAQAASNEGSADTGKDSPDAG